MEQAKNGDAEIQCQVGVHDVHGQVATSQTGLCATHADGGGQSIRPDRRGERTAWAGGGEKLIGCAGGDSGIGRRATYLYLHRVGVCGHLIAGQHRRWRTSGFADTVVRQTRTLAHANGHPPLQVGQAEGVSAVAAIGGTQQREHGAVLGDGHDLAVAQRPVSWREVEGEGLNSADKYFHEGYSRFLSGRPASGAAASVDLLMGTLKCRPESCSRKVAEVNARL